MTKQQTQATTTNNNKANTAKLHEKVNLRRQHISSSAHSSDEVSELPSELKEIFGKLKHNSELSGLVDMVMQRSF